MTKRSKITKNGKLVIPEFKSYEQEAKWFDDHRDELIEHLFKHGKVVGARNVERTQQVTLRIPESDLERAKSIAQSTGKPYQRVLKDAMREGLKRAG